jgi:hypothetical protein
LALVAPEHVASFVERWSELDPGEATTWLRHHEAALQQAQAELQQEAAVQAAIAAEERLAPIREMQQAVYETLMANAPTWAAMSESG